MNDNNKVTVTNNTIGFAGLLTIVFIVLKLLGKINWPWIWVLSPIWISIAISVIAFAIAVILISKSSRW